MWTFYRLFALKIECSSPFKCKKRAQQQRLVRKITNSEKVTKYAKTALLNKIMEEKGEKDEYTFFE
jgi:hypothetical protein